MTMTAYTDEQIETLARRRAKAKMGWFIHAFVYLCVNAGLLLIWTYNDRSYRFGPVFGWGFGLALHGLAVWFVDPTSRLSERLIESERNKLKQMR